MKYKCINELDKFMFQDADVIKFNWTPEVLTMELAGAAARHNNPANDLLTDRYLDDTQMRLRAPRLTRFFLEGAKYYNADNLLVEEVPDQEIPQEERAQTFAKLSGGRVFVITPKDAFTEGLLCCEMAIDVGEDTYWLELEYEKAVVEWEHFLNKVQQ